MIPGIRKAGETNVTSTPHRGKTHKGRGEEESQAMQEDDKSDSEMITEMRSMMEKMEVKTNQAQI